MVKATFAKPVSRIIASKNRKAAQELGERQKKTLSKLVSKASSTLFGREHNFEKISSYTDFKETVPIRGYEELKPYISKIQSGEKDVLWPGKPLYFAKTSGTTSGAKYIPLTKASIPNHIDGARNLLMHYIDRTGNSDVLNRKMIFLSGSPLLDRSETIPTGRLSGIVNRHIPAWAKGNQLPSWETNCIEDWEEKLDKICEETIGADLGLISGIPPWMQMYFDFLKQKTGKKVGELFPNLSVLAFGGVNFKPYAKKLLQSVGREVDLMETYPASEGFFAFQDLGPNEGLLLQPDGTLFFEFIPMKEYGKPDAPRLPLWEVEKGQNYAIVISNNAGLWAYDIGDVVKFVSINPYRVLVTGRTKHFLSAFGEHVISEEVERAIEKALGQFPQLEVREFHVAPQVNPESGQPYHEWFIATDHPPSDPGAFSRYLNQEMIRQNIYYRDLMDGKILSPLKITYLKADAFERYMAELGKLGGQNKVPRLANDRKLADQLSSYA